MKYIAIIQQRIGSTRLPGKAMMPLLGKKSATECLIERVKRSKYLDEIVLAVPDSKENKVLINLAKKLNIQSFSGDEDDVLERVCSCIAYYRLKLKDDITVIDITGDCPLIEGAQIDKMIQLYNKGQVDYLSNVITRTLPDGFDTQLYDGNILLEINLRLKYSIEQRNLVKNHTGWNILNFADGYKILNMAAWPKYTHPEWGLTLDTIEDYHVLKNIFAHFGNLDFTVIDVLDYVLANPEILEANKDVIRKMPGSGK